MGNISAAEMRYVKCCMDHVSVFDNISSCFLQKCSVLRAMYADMILEGMYYLTAKHHHMYYPTKLLKISAFLYCAIIISATRLPPDLLDIPKEQIYLYLSGKQSDNVSLYNETFQHLGHLQDLQIINFGVSQIDPGAFQWLVNLKRLSISENCITKIQTPLFHALVHLKELYLDSNSIYTVTADAFLGLYSLLVLSLTDNKISHISNGTFRALVSLEHLYLYGNVLRHVGDKVFLGVNSLKNSFFIQQHLHESGLKCHKVSKICVHRVKMKGRNMHVFLGIQ